MSDEDGTGTLVQGPWSGDSTYVPPPIPDYGDTIPPPEDIPESPPESPEETTMSLPTIPAPPDPSATLHSDGIMAPETGEDDGEYEEGEYEQPRSLADRLGDWLEFRLEKARALHEGEAPYREAEVARKAALLQGRTAQEVAMMEQNGKLHTAMMKAKGDKAAARGRADADRAKASGSGLGADKGRSKAAGGGGATRGGGSGGSGSGSSRKASGPGPNRPGASRGSNSGAQGHRSGSGTSGGSGGGKGGARGSERGSGGRAAGSGRNGSSAGSKGSQTGSGASGRGSGGGARGERSAPASGARAERARGRQERAGTRQAGRQERHGAGHAAGIADRSKDRDQARAQRQQAWEDRRAKRQERHAARKTKREAAASATPDRTTLGQAIGEEAQSRWDKRHKGAQDPKDAGAAGTEKVNLSKDKNAKTKATDSKGKGGKSAPGAPGGSSGAAKDGAAGDGPKPGAAAGDRRSDSANKWRRFRRRHPGDGSDGRRGRARHTRRTGRPGRTGRRGRPSGSPFGPPQDSPTVEWPDRPTRRPRTDSTRTADDIVDADIVPDRPKPVTTGARGLPPAPEKHTKRPGTSRPGTKGSGVSTVKTSGQGGLRTQHRTDITFDQYLVEMANTATRASSDQERAEALMQVLSKVAAALREMAADLSGNHNIDTAVTNRITDLADSAGRMKAQSQRCAEQCSIAKEAAKLAAAMVARVYGQDMDAKEDAGLTHASAATHHD